MFGTVRSFARLILALREEFDTRFQDLKKNNFSYNLSSSTSSISTGEAPEDLQIECADC